MPSRLATRDESHSPRLGLVIALAFLFWAFTYGLVVLRAELAIDEQIAASAGYRRLFGTLAGALAYGLVLRWIFRADQRRGFSRSLAIIGTVLPASLLVLAVRAIANATLYETPQPWEENVRWVLVWSGYFGLWVCATLAFQIRAETARPCAAARVPLDVHVADAAPAIEVPAALPAHAPEALSEVWLAFIDSAAEELSDLPDPDRAALIERLSATAAYELADDHSGGVHNARVDLTRRILARMTDDGAGR